ncbi:hypothetical protein AB0L75_41135 [Streptomyces sp. NPDC052101]|uniref:hypothetical protein n=1 Tax=Streptomyces sp. NPDC052101 TaxID=3155763 RepID=UPI003432BA40
MSTTWARPAPAGSPATSSGPGDPVAPACLGLLLAGGGPMVPSTFLALPVALLA